MSQEPEKIHVQIKYKGVEQQFCSDPQDAWLMVNQFFKDFIPSFEIAHRIRLSVDLKQLAEDLGGIVAFSNEGVSLLSPKNKLTDNEALSIWLTAQYLGNQLGMLNNEALSKDELQAKLGKNGKTISTRLGELAKNGAVQKTADDKFRITTYGVTQTQKEVVPKIKSKIKA